MSEEKPKHDHDWNYEVKEMWYVMVTRQCQICDEKQETKAGLDDNDFEVISK